MTKAYLLRKSVKLATSEKQVVRAEKHSNTPTLQRSNTPTLQHSIASEYELMLLTSGDTNLICRSPRTILFALPPSRLL